MLVVSPESRDYSANGGMSHFYEAIWFTNMPPGIELGHKVEVWAEGGGVLESYPAQGRADRAEVLDQAKPKGAVMSESEAIRKVITSYEMNGISDPVITGAKYDPSAARWTVSLARNGKDKIISVEVFDQEQEPDMGELYGLALNAFMPIDEALNGDMKYIAVDMSHLENVDDIDKQQILKALSGYEVPVKNSTFEQLWEEEAKEREANSTALQGVLLRVDQVELSKERMVLEGSKFRAEFGAIGMRVVVELADGLWQVTKADLTWIS
ncbi:hypothetical protein PCURB6_43550 [Paenibacillus curdlanolyticus]|nr:hypothetical protein PCURB6_43550 [Paenibacillus curdlanolyticus]